MANANFKSILLDATIEKLSIDELVRLWTILLKETPDMYIWDKNKLEDMKMLMGSFEKVEQSAQWASIMSFPNRYFMCDKMVSENLYVPLTIDMIANDMVRKYWDDLFPIIAQNPHKLDEIEYFDNVYYPCMIEGVKPKFDYTKEREKFFSKAAALVSAVNKHIETKLYWDNSHDKWVFYNFYLNVWATQNNLEIIFAHIWQHHFNNGKETFVTPKTIEWEVYYCHGILGNANLGFSIGYKNGEIFVKYPSQNHQLFPNC